jgi:hypothetical protein
MEDFMGGQLLLLRGVQLVLAGKVNAQQQACV